MGLKYLFWNEFGKLGGEKIIYKEYNDRLLDLNVIAILYIEQPSGRLLSSFFFFECDLYERKVSKWLTLKFIKLINKNQCHG